jgi:hypothetical protein
VIWSRYSQGFERQRIVSRSRGTLMFNAAISAWYLGHLIDGFRSSSVGCVVDR